MLFIGQRATAQSKTEIHHGLDMVEAPPFFFNGFSRLAIIGTGRGVREMGR
jgi:hypothetical protein